ncbi:prenyltransferase [Parendozoicomonas haliclonae]|uniref:1,4-dihydroxy-2-naphthoate octaprenyltransferase n=1 Tax=Parendozoicomonas haliclonae TaxID=1960125 RepID=A0A1X7AMR5_9GAMM|nr:prenyltransferase [Parendozoicomonas haliclonae]SMA49310.1 1,4-dihydroxy-2-naphthoate octaprenyltransferase [Parendozoicomonas haliclonae]
MSSERTALPGPAKYFFLRALRPFSLSVTLVTCGLGITLAGHDGMLDVSRAVLVMIAGMLLQSAVNLFNDYADVELWERSDGYYANNVLAMIRRNLLVAKIMAGLSVAIGLVLVFQAGWELLVIGALGLAGGYFYTGQPIAYKNRGGGVFAVFLFTGVLMVVGSYVAVTGEWSYPVVLYSIPVSMISSMLLLANELRDVQDDAVNNIGTFTVRAGAPLAELLYRTLAIGALLYAWGLGFSGGMNFPWIMFVPALALKEPFQILKASKMAHQRNILVKLPPVTGRYFVVFGICMMLAI